MYVYGVSIYIYIHKIKQLVYEAYTEAWTEAWTMQFVSLGCLEDLRRKWVALGYPSMRQASIGHSQCLQVFPNSKTLLWGL